MAAQLEIEPTEPTKTPRMTAKEVLARLERHYIKPGADLPGGVFLPEVTLGRAGGARCDAIFVNFTSSRGRYMIGHEIKVARSDWLHELDQPEKAEFWASQCHSWYVVAPSTDIVRPDELPPGWGLLTCDSGSKTRLRIVRGARDFPDRQPSWNAALSVISRHDTLRAQAINAARLKARTDAKEQLDELVESEIARRTPSSSEVHRLKGVLGEYEDALGVRLVSAGAYTDAEIQSEDLAAVGELLRSHKSLRRAAESLHHRYSSSGLDRLQQTIDAMNSALASVRSHLGEWVKD